MIFDSDSDFIVMCWVVKRRWLKLQERFFMIFIYYSLSHISGSHLGLGESLQHFNEQQTNPTCSREEDLNLNQAIYYAWKSQLTCRIARNQGSLHKLLVIFLSIKLQLKWTCVCFLWVRES